jgi:hypothetical protein
LFSGNTRFNQNKTLLNSGLAMPPVFFTHENKWSVRMNKIPLETIDDESAIRYRDCFSVRYIQSAAVLCRLGYRIEKDFLESGEISEEARLRHEAFILNSILSSVAFLESTINELYSDAADNAYFFYDEKNETLLKTISEKWKNEKNFDRAPLVNKYQKILMIAEKPPFDEDNPVFSNIRILIEIRNSLMHYKREWIVMQQGERPGDNKETLGEKLEKMLRYKFVENPLAQKNRPFFPDRCFGHGCAEWAVVNSLSCTDDFFEKLELPAPYDWIKKELETK